MRYLCALVFMCWSGAVVAAATEQPLSLTLVGDHLDQMQVGVPSTIEVWLSNIPPAASVNYLSATVAFDSGLLGEPTITIGGAVPDAAGFSASSGLGLADALYDSLGSASQASLINAGLFYSFEVTPIVSGVGAFRFAFADALGAENGGSPIDGVVTGAAVPFTVLAVPEPTTLVLLSLASLAAFSKARRRANRQR